MTEDEKNLLLEIDKLYTELINEPFGRWTGSYHTKPDGGAYCKNAEKIKNIIFKLYNDFNPEYLDENDLDMISHTCEKEVGYVDYHYDLSIKNNAPKIRNTEFLNAMGSASDRIRRELSSVFEKIDEIKD